MRLAHKLRRVSGAPALTTLTYIGVGSSTGPTVVIPATAQEGDFAVLIDYTWGSVTDVIPTGFTQLHLGGNSGDRMLVSGKVLEASDPGATITGANSSGEQKLVLVFRGDVPITEFAAFDWSTQVTTGNPTAQGVAAAAQPAPLLVLGAAGVEGGTASFSTHSPAFDNALIRTSDNDLCVGYKIYDSSPADHTIDCNDMGTVNILSSGGITLA